MSTLAEIQAAADALPLEQKQELLRFLASRLNDKPKAQTQRAVAQFAGTIQLPEDPLAWQLRIRGEWG